MVGVSGQVAFITKKGNDTELGLSYDWESHVENRPRYEYTGDLSGLGETQFFIESHNVKTDEYTVVKSWLYRGGGDCNFEGRFIDVPEKVMKGWEKEVSKYQKKGIKKRRRA